MPIPSTDLSAEQPKQKMKHILAEVFYYVNYVNVIT